MNKNNKSSYLVYVAVPYLNRSNKVINSRFEKVTRFSARLVSEGYRPYSPITHNHLINKYLDLSLEHHDWLKYDFLFLKHCKKLFVLKLPGWEDSIGVAAEIKMAKKLGIPIKYFNE